MLASSRRLQERETTLAEGLARMAPWAKATGARTSGVFNNIEIEQKLPPSWRV